MCVMRAAPPDKHGKQPPEKFTRLLLHQNLAPRSFFAMVNLDPGSKAANSVEKKTKSAYFIRRQSLRDNSSVRT